MTVRYQMYHQVICESCSAVFGEVGQFNDAATARRSALSAGWSLIPKVLRSGKRGKVIDIADDRALSNASTTNRDFCPNCRPCLACDGVPPSGFTCNACGAKADRT